jgi:hypothetical protein
LALLIAAALLPASGSAHPGHAGVGASSGGKGFLSTLAGPGTTAAVDELFAPARTAQAPLPPGPCTERAKRAMPTGAPHDHRDIGAHASLRCRIEQVAFLPLKGELADRENVILGEIDVAADIAAVAVTYPRAGALFFDVSDPSRPRFLSRYDGTECDQLLIDINCGAFVDLAEDGKTAYLSLQKLTFLPTLPLNPNSLRQSLPGVDVIDLADPRRPRLTQAYPIAGIGGVHTVRSHTIPEGPSTADKPRAPGEYVISNQNGVGIDIARVTRVNGKRVLSTVRQVGTLFVEATIVNNEVHDTFIQNDPLDGRTYLYDAAGFTTGFYVYDITDPARLELVAEWDPTPECDEDWYGHTIDVTHRNGRRYVTMPAELFLQIDRNTPSGLSEMTGEDRQEGCGTFVGNGDKLGPLWIVDATDLSRLGPANDLKSSEEADATDATLKRNSLAALVTTWTNPANRAGGSLTFSPHNQQIVGDKIYLSHYHGGVYVLDAKAAFAGRRERPRELGFIVPSGAPTRPLLGQPGLTGITGRFFTDFPLGRPEIWDAVHYKGHILGADMTGGFYSFRYDGDRCNDRTAPRSRIDRRRTSLSRRGALVRGRSGDRGCRGTRRSLDRAGKLRRVEVSVARRVGRRCRFLRRNGRFTGLRRCSRPGWVRARGTTRFSLRRRAALPAGVYEIRVRGVDTAGNAERRAGRRNVIVRRVAG